MSTVSLNGATLNRAALNRSALNRSAVRDGAVSHLRLTRRGRRVLVFLVAFPLVVAATVFALNGGLAAASGSAGTPLQYATVGAGESLWQLAQTVAPSADPREVISEIVHLNQLSGADVQAGERLAIPAKYSR